MDEEINGQRDLRTESGTMEQGKKHEIGNKRTEQMRTKPFPHAESPGFVSDRASSYDCGKRGLLHDCLHRRPSLRPQLRGLYERLLGQLDKLIGFCLSLSKGEI